MLGFPNYFQTYLDSVGMNKDCLKILLVTDKNTSQYRIPSNINIIECTLEEVYQKFYNFMHSIGAISTAEKNKIRTHEKTYNGLMKLCALKTVNRFLYEQELKDIGLKDGDFWGWADIDVIYGKISNVIPDFKKYDFIGSLGHFSLVKNKKECHKLMIDDSNFINALKRETYKSVDEREYVDILNKMPSDFKFLDIYNKICDKQFVPFIKNSFFSLKSETLHIEYDKEKLPHHYKNAATRNHKPLYIHFGIDFLNINNFNKSKVDSKLNIHSNFSISN